MPEYFPQIQQNQGLAEAIAAEISKRGQAWGNAFSGVGQNIGQGLAQQAQLAREKQKATITPQHMLSLRQFAQSGGRPQVSGPPLGGSPNPLTIGQNKPTFAGGIDPNQPLNQAKSTYLQNIMERKATEDRMLALQGLKGEQATKAQEAKSTQATSLEDLKAQHKQELLEWQKANPKPASQSLGLRDEQFWERQKVSAGKDLNVSRASSRSPLGVAVTNNQKARRALKLLEGKGTFTPQDQSLITTDLTAMMKGGSPDEELLRQQQYPSYYASGINLLQKITAKPQNLNDPEIKAHLKEVITGIVNVDDNVIKDHIDSTENQYADLIAKDPKWWEKTKSTASRNLFNEVGSSGTKESGNKESKSNDPLGIL